MIILNRDKKLKKERNNIRNNLRARLSFDEGFAENPLYSIRAFTNEKDKGIDMIDLVKTNFSICEEDIRRHMENKMKEWQKDSMKPTEYPKGSEPKRIVWKRDERGNIISPFSKEAQKKDSQS